jgi:hypothetical protein
LGSAGGVAVVVPEELEVAVAPESSWVKTPADRYGYP